MATTIFLVNPREGGVTPPSYLLDTYSAAAAYSLRQLKTGVTSVVRVRRSSDNREENFTATEITDGTLTGFCGGGNGFVVTWYDQVGSNNWTQSTASEQFKIVSSGTLITNSDGNTSTQSVGNWYSLTTPWVETQEIAMFLVGEQTTSRYTSLGNSGASFTFFSMQNGTGKMQTRIGTTNITWSGSVPTGAMSLFEVHRDSSDNVNLYYDSVADASNPLTSALDTTYDYDYFGRYYTTQSLNAYFNEFILFESDQSANRTDIEDDINTYYSIY